MKTLIVSVRKWFLLGVLLIAFLLFYSFHLYRFLSFSTLQSYQVKALHWASRHYQMTVTCYLIFLTVLIACGIPAATIFTLLGGFMFGITGFIYAMLGITLGGIILFLAVRTAIGSKIKAKSSGWIKSMESGFQQNAFHYLLMLRLIPIFPCGVSNIAAGALNVPLKTFIFATLLGIAPATLIYILIGRGLDQVLNNIHDVSQLTTPSILLPLIGLTLLSFFPIIYKYVKKNKSKSLEWIDIATRDLHVKTSLLLTGIGLRPAHYHDILEKRPEVAWLEAHSENYFGEGSKSLQVLEKIRRDYPVSLHGVGLSLGSADELNWSHLKKLRDLSQCINPCLISEHLSWSSINGHHLHDLLPLPYTEEALTHLCDRIKQVQDFLQQQILIENISSYISYKHSTLPEWDFLSYVAREAECGILLDINNIYVSAYNLNFNAETYIQSIQPDDVQEIHLAGFSTASVACKEILIDSHSEPVAPPVWDLYRLAIKHLGRKPTMIEWDNQLPTLETLCSEAYRAEETLRECYELAKSAS